MKIPNFAAKAPFAGYFELRNQFWHTSAISQHSDPHFAAAKWAAKKRENAIATVCSFLARARRREPPVISSGHHFRPNFVSPIWREPEEPNLLSFQPQTSPARGPVQGPTSEPPRPEAASPPAKPAPQNPPARRYLTRSGGVPCKRSQGQSSEPIDLTEQSRFPHQSPLRHHLRRRRQSLGGAQEHQPPLSESQIPSGIAPEPPSNCGRLADSFHLLRRYRMEHLLTPRDFFYPRVAMDFYQSMTTNQRASTNPHLLRRELPPSMFLIDALLHNIYPLQHWTQRRGVLLEALFRISEGYFFGPHHLIMAALLYFEEKILEHLGYPSDPQLERKRICREVFTLDKWTNMTAYRAEQPELPQPAEIPAAREHLQIIYLRRFMPHTADPDRVSEQPCSGDGSYSSSPGADVDHPGSAHAILRQLQHHLGLPSAAEHLTPPLQCHTHRPQSLRPS
ncbi:hypothetical protein CK203_101804 [Vitis vinifera]|uniref:Uncharacterized protein n=1 Tax=Vitis vinifera TaxID=29760 RepID=A0A438FFS5_VITVI|nr:hypothetical protein CK203_101804 [Vitis vinifera]